MILGFAVAGLLGTLAFALLLPTVTLGAFRSELQRERTERLERAALDHVARTGSLKGFRPDPAWGGSDDLARSALVLDAAGELTSPSTSNARPPGNWRARRDTRVLTRGGRVVGYVVPGAPPHDTPEERALLSSVGGSLTLAALIRVLLVLALGALLTRGMMRSLHHLTREAQRFTLGGAYQPLDVRGHDEVAVLTAAFNAMRAQIDRADGNRRRLVADVAHDLGTPLTVASGYVQAMVAGRLAPTPDRLLVVQGELDLMRGLIDDLRLLSRVDAGELPLDVTLIEPRALLLTVHAAFAERARTQQVSLSVHAADVPRVPLDDLRVRQVLGNLVSNALNHTPEGGAVRIEGRARGDAVEFVVSDTGEGIDETHLPFVFERFYRADAERSGSGTGLGLSIARSLTELLGGQVSVHSRRGVGTTATVTFPRVTGVEDARDGAASRARPRSEPYGSFREGA
ncbi:sensor histidine kinase [Deinococcus pimensis]|uniref:sensor histidine kinase n=1 Tax=Deinococcus pimensis TaxID=309888 RepID=UPI0006946E81|nr:HAMP domain-containing sensor histidine kinase [Deinococcus pimensis]